MYIKPENFNIAALDKLYGIFDDGFQGILNSAFTDEKAMLFKVYPSFFRKWIFSALIEDTPLTPANIMRNMTGREFTFSLKAQYENGIFSCSPLISEDTIENSIFINDLKYLCCKCQPVGDYDFFSDESIYSLAEYFPDVFISDGYYISYIALIAKRLGLIKTMPAINAVKYQAQEAECKKFFSLEPVFQHKEIVNAVIDIFIEKTTAHIQAPFPVSSREGIYSVISQSCITDAIFAHIYSSVGFDFEKIADLGKKSSLSEDDEALVSSVLYLGILIDKWLITPLGSYMGLIIPQYSSPFSFSEDYDYIRPVITTGCDLSFELFAPPNYYVISDKGNKIFGDNQIDCRDYCISGVVTDSDLDEMIRAYRMFSSMLEASIGRRTAAKNIYKLTVSFKNNRDMWKILEMPCESTLSQLNNEINTYFGFSSSESFCFTFGSNEYRFGSRFKFINSAEKTTLLSLGLTDGSIISYTNGFDKNLDLIITSSAVAPAEKNALYPRLFRQSRAITLRERSDEF